MSETGFHMATRKTLERDITEAFNAKDMRLVDSKLDIYSGGLSRRDLSDAEMRVLCPGVARFFRDELATRNATQEGDTEEIPVVTPEMIQRAT